VIKSRVTVKEEDEAPDRRATLSSATAQTSGVGMQRDTSALQSYSPSESPVATPEEGVDFPLHAPHDSARPTVLSTLLPPGADIDIDSAGNSTPVSPAHHTPNCTPPRTPQPMHRPRFSAHPSTPPQPTYHETHQMLRILTGLINATSFDPNSTTSIEYKINEIDQLLNEKVIPRLMKVDKDVKDLVWMR
jgi:hypothetical protein